MVQIRFIEYYFFSKISYHWKKPKQKNKKQKKKKQKKKTNKIK